MEFNFATLAANTEEKAEKKLESMKKDFVKKLGIALDFIYPNITKEQRDHIDQEISDIWNDENKRHLALVAQCLNKCKRSLDGILK